MIVELTECDVWLPILIRNGKMNTTQSSLVMDSSKLTIWHYSPTHSLSAQMCVAWLQCRVTECCHQSVPLKASPDTLYESAKTSVHTCNLVLSCFSTVTVAIGKHAF